MNENAVHLKDLIIGADLTRAATADLLYVSLDTLHKWLKPATTANRNPCPRWAVELLAYKTHQKIPSMSLGAIEGTLGVRKRNTIDEESVQAPTPKPKKVSKPGRAAYAGAPAKPQKRVKAT